MSGNIINDFKDLRSLIGEVTKANPAKTTYQQNAQNMGVMKEAPEAKPEDDKKAKALKARKDHAGEEEIKKAYMNLGRAAQGSVEYQRKLIQKELAKMGYKTYSKYAFDDIFKFENFQLESALADMQDIVKTKGAKKVGGVMVDMFTASVITKAYEKVNDANKKKMEKANVHTLVKVAHKIMGMKEELELDEGKMSDLLIDIQQGATAKELAKDYKIPLSVAKGFLQDYYGQKRSSRKEDVQEGMKLKDVMRKHGRELKKVSKSNSLELSKKAEDDLMTWAMDAGEIRTDDPDEFDQWLDNNIDDIVKGRIKEENLQEGTWAVPDSYKKLYNLQVGFLSNKRAATELNSRKLLVDIYTIFGDDSLYDDVEKYIDNPDPKFDLRDLIVKHLKRFGLKFSNSYKITHAPEEWIDNLGKSESKIEERLIEGKPRRGRGNIKKPRGKIVVLKMSREDKLKEQKEHAKQSPFKLKSQKYPRAIPINNDGFGKRHATVEDIIAACDSFGMILDKELQIEQIQKELGKKGFISYNRTELKDVFDDRETERMILALETITEKQEPIDYSKAEVEEYYIMGEEIEFVKPDGHKTVGPILKMSGNTYNVKDKFTGKSFTYKYIGEAEVKTFSQVINEGRFPKKLVKMAMGIVWDKRYVGGNMTGAVQAIEKIKKGLSDDPDVRNALRLANEGINKWIPEGGDKEAYVKFFKKALDKFGVNSPEELEGEKKKEFFNYVDKNWKGDHEEVETNPSNSKIDGRRKNFREKMRKLGYIKQR